MDSDSDGELGGFRAHQSSPMLQMFRETGHLKPAETPGSYSANPNFIQRLTLQRKLQGHSGCVNTVAFSPCGTRLFTGSDDRLIKLWNWEQGIQLLSWNSGHYANVFQARAFPHSDGNTIVSSAADGQVRVACIPQGASSHIRSRQVGLHGGRAHKITFTDHPWTFLSCGEDGLVNFYDLRHPSPATPLVTVASLRGRPLELYSVATNPINPSEFCLGGQDEAIRVFDLRRSTTGYSRALPLHYLAPRGLCSNNRLFNPHLTCAVYSCRGEILASYNDDDIYLLSPEAVRASPGDKSRTAMADGRTRKEDQRIDQSHRGGGGGNRRFNQEDWPDDEEKEERGTRKGITRFDSQLPSTSYSHRQRRRSISPADDRRVSNPRLPQRRRQGGSSARQRDVSRDDGPSTSTRNTRRNTVNARNNHHEAREREQVSKLRWLYGRLKRARTQQRCTVDDATIIVQQFAAPELDISKLDGQDEQKRKQEKDCTTLRDNEGSAGTTDDTDIPRFSFLGRLQAYSRSRAADRENNFHTDSDGDGDYPGFNSDSDDYSFDPDAMALIGSDSEIGDSDDEESDEESDEEGVAEERNGGSRWQGPVWISKMPPEGFKSSMENVSGGVIQVFKGKKTLTRAPSTAIASKS